jgi:uncharacterized membrane protein required for colicin V production
MVSNFLDITYIAIVCLSTAAGLYSGAVKLIISFIFLILSFIFAYLIFVPVTDIMHEYVSSNFMVHVASAAVSYLLCAISCAIIASKLKALVVDISGGATDRFIGLLLGGARGVAVSFIIFVAVTIFTTKSYETAKNVFELVVTNSKIPAPHWVVSSKFNPELRQLLDQAIDFVGKDGLKKILLPKREVRVSEPEHKDPFRAMENKNSGV